MKRSTVLEMKKEKWLDLESVGLKVLCVPAALPIGMVSDIARSSDDGSHRDFCENVFLDFKGYTEMKGKREVNVKNTLVSRLELFSVATVRTLILAACITTSAEILEGEGVAASE